MGTKKMMKDWTSKIKKDSNKFRNFWTVVWQGTPLLSSFHHLVAVSTMSLGSNCVKKTHVHLCTKKNYATKNTNNVIPTRNNDFLLESSMFEQAQVASSIILVPAILYQTSPIGMLAIHTMLWPANLCLPKCANKAQQTCDHLQPQWARWPVWFSILFDCAFGTVLWK